MKKILLLGGSAQQIVAIGTAKRLGYNTVLCDYLPDNPGQYHADKFYLVSTTDKDAVLQVARKERVDGVLAYASDPAAPTAAYVAEKLGLPTNPYSSVETLCNKDMFRAFLRENGYNAPQSAGYSEKSEVIADIARYRFPIIIKPVDSSGSKGATVLHSLDGLEAAIEFAFSFSRSHRIIVEEFIEKKHEYLIGGDVFVADGRIVLWGLMNCHRDQDVNPLVPVGKSYPLTLGDRDVRAVKDTLQKMVEDLGLKFGSVNVELVVDKSDRVWPIDIGPRAGGNMIPDLLSMIFGLDVVELAVRTAMGEAVHVEPDQKSDYLATHNLHSAAEGVLEDIGFSDELERYIIRTCIYVKAGDDVHYFDNASKALGIIFMRFPDGDTQKRILSHINDYISIELR